MNVQMIWFHLSVYCLIPSRAEIMEGLQDFGLYYPGEGIYF